MNQTFTFPEGLLGFEEVREMQLVPIDVDFNATFYELMSEDEEIGFLLVDPFKLHPNYQVQLNDELKEKLNAEKAEEVIVLTMVTLKDSLSTSTTNLKAPLIFNLTKKQAYQWVDSSAKFSLRHPLVAIAKEEK